MIVSFHELVGFSGEYQNEIIVSLVVIAGILALQFVITHFLKRIATLTNMGKGQLKTLRSVINIFLVVIAATIIVFQFSATTGIIASAITLSAGTIVGFASINTVGNVIAGILLLTARPYKIGDRIRISGNEPVFGDVIEITLIYTKVRTIHRELVSIPNQNLLKEEIVNYSGLESVAVVVYVSMEYSNDRSKIESLLIDSALKVDRIIKAPKPYVLISEFDTFAAIYELRAFTDIPNEYFRVQSDIRKKIYDVFTENGLDLSTANIIANRTKNNPPHQFENRTDTAIS